MDPNGETYVTHALRASYDASGDPAPALNGDARLAVVGSFNAKAGGDMRGIPQQVRDHAGTVNANNPPAVFGAGVRRLTERECERLQAFPDDWTRWAADGSEISSGSRYKMIGNAVTSSVARWIGERLKRAMATA
jgi:site-specific DNA-cytosine methylase